MSRESVRQKRPTVECRAVECPTSHSSIGVSHHVAFGFVVKLLPARFLKKSFLISVTGPGGHRQRLGLCDLRGTVALVVVSEEKWHRFRQIHRKRLESSLEVQFNIVQPFLSPSKEIPELGSRKDLNMVLHSCVEQNS